MSLADLEAARENCEAKIAAAMAATLVPTNSVGGRSFDWDGHLRELRAQLKDINAMIIKRRGPQMVRTRVLG